MKSNKYLKISNSGEIDPMAFTLIGASTKRDDKDKIGFFGSGLKYSIAFLLRNEIEFSCFSGKTKIEFSVKQEKFRDQEFGVICVDGKPTSMTTGMGVDWKTWFIVREIYCNAIDEGGESIDTTEEPESEEGKTNFYISVNDEIQDLIHNWDDYFSLNRDGLLYSDKDMNGLYMGGFQNIVYRKGIRCFHSEQKSMFHYDMSWVVINESRVIADQWDFRLGLLEFFQKLTDEKIIKRILRNVCYGWEKDIGWGMRARQYSDEWLSSIGERVLVQEETAGQYVEEMAKAPHLILPSSMCEGLKDRFGDEVTIMGMRDGFDISCGFKDVETSPKQDFLLKEVEGFLKEIGYPVKYPITVCSFANNKILGLAGKNIIYLSEKLFDMGRREIAMTIIEESEHLNTDFEDETRAFQNHFISKFLTSMEERHGTFL